MKELLALIIILGFTSFWLWLAVKYGRGHGIDIKDLGNYVQWKKETKYKPNKDN